ncbi:MAG: hypothetical protein AAGH74_07185 [Pseudomonadota bacterium]
MSDPTPTTPVTNLLTGLIGQLQSEKSYLDDLRSEIRGQEGKVLRLYEAARTTYLTLSDAERRDHRFDMLDLKAAIHYGPRSTERFLGRERAVIDFLAQNRRKVIKVAEVHQTLNELGYNLPHGYASNALIKLERYGICDKVRYARYKANEMHPEILGRG